MKDFVGRTEAARRIPAARRAWIAAGGTEYEFALALEACEEAAAEFIAEGLRQSEPDRL
jgi:hypothetical protein